MRRRLSATAFAAVAAVSLGLEPAAGAQRQLSFGDLQGWGRDDMRPALRAFRATCGVMEGAHWRAACAAAPEAATKAAARAFFEAYFAPRLVGGGTLFTGYYEPEIRASPVATPRFAYPIYRKPPDLIPGRRWYDRATIERRGLLRGRGLELAWLADPVDVFFLQIQGSGRLKMPDGSVLRVGFAAKNGRPYRSVGLELVRRGIFRRSEVSADRIRAWVHAHPEAGRALLQTNPSFVFFRKVDLPPDKGPIGAMGLPLTAGRSLAVDPDFVPLGAPVWVQSGGTHPLHRLMVAQDVGSAIKGAGRADVFIGSGTRAGRIAGTMRDRGRMVILWPRPARDAEKLAEAEK